MRLFLIVQLVIHTMLNAYAQGPNIVWITCEDISPTLSFYGDSTASTPNLDRLAAESIIFNQAFATVGVCAPARSSLITGMYPVSIGTHQMRTGRDISGWGERQYDEHSGHYDLEKNYVPLHSIVTPPDVKCFTEYLRKEGYYCTNNVKTDYQFAAPVTAWDANSPDAHYRNRAEGQAFFSVFNHNVTHESRLWMNDKLPLTVDPGEVPVPPYLPDHPEIRKGIARNYSNIELLDEEVGQLIDELEAEGLLSNTIIFFFSDHGGPLPRGKREHYESGLRVPLLVRMPDDLKQQYTEKMVSFVDFAPTVLSLAGIPAPEHFQGRAFLGEYQSKEPRQHIFGTGDRFDEYADRIRSVISENFVYVKNFHPDLPAYKDVEYRKNIPMMDTFLRLESSGQLNEDQQYWFREKKKKEEFYLRKSDPYSLNNIIDESKYQEQIEAHRQALDLWQSDINDLGWKLEREHLEDMWPGGVQPVTKVPQISQTGNSIKLSCNTEGSSIAYIISEKEFDPDLDAGWQLYHEPIKLERGQQLYVMGVRIGFADSEVKHYKAKNK